VNEIPSKPSSGPAIAAAILPPLFAVLGLILMFGVVGGGEPLRLFYEGGPFAYLTLGSAFACSVALALFLYFAARGAKVPIPLPIAIALFPWLVGLAGMRIGVAACAAAIVQVNPLDRATIAAAGFSEATADRLIGSWMSGALLAATAIGLGLGAINLRAPERSSAGGAFALVAVPLLAVTVMLWLPVGSAAIAFGISAVGVALAFGLAGAGTGNDERTPHLAIGAAVASVLAWMASGTFAHSVATHESFAAVAMVNPADKATILAAGLSALVQSEAPLAASRAWLAVAVVLLIVHAFRRSTWAREAVAGAAVAAVLAVAAFFGDVWLTRTSSRELSPPEASAWATTPDFEPLIFWSDGEPEDPAAVATPAGLIPVGKAPIPWGSGTALTDFFRAAIGPESTPGRSRYDLEERLSGDQIPPGGS
jgi:hypothetical protein